MENASPPSPKRFRQDQANLFLGLSVAATVILYVVPYGDVIGYPLMLISTLVHELGHGVLALATGGRFIKLEVWADGSGAATFSMAADAGRLSYAAVAMGGLVGPAVAGGMGFAFSREPKSAQIALSAVSIILLVTLALVVRTWVGFILVSVFAATCLLVVLRTRPEVAQILLVFLSVQLALSVFSRGDYLFTDTASTGGGSLPSDTAQIAQALFLPYWFWGALCGAFSIAVLWLGLRTFFHRSRLSPHATNLPRGGQ